MWNPGKSVQLSCIVTRIVMVASICFVFTAPFVVERYLEFAGRSPDILSRLLFVVYAGGVPALVALFSLDRLLGNIKRGEIFVERNVRHLRILSWCCFAAAVILMTSGFYYVLFVIIAFAAAFFGLILRVVKNVIEQAVILKNENDYTI